MQGWILRSQVGLGGWAQCTPSARGAEATQGSPWSPHLCATPRVNGAWPPAWPSWAPGRFPCSSSDAGPGRRRRSLLLLPCTGSSRRSSGPDSGNALRQASPASWLPSLPAVMSSLDLPPPSVAAALLCQLSEKPRPRFSQLDVYRPDSQLCLPSTPIKERQAHAVLENGPFQVNALF